MAAPAVLGVLGGEEVEVGGVRLLEVASVQLEVVAELDGVGTSSRMNVSFALIRPTDDGRGDMRGTVLRFASPPLGQLNLGFDPNATDPDLRVCSLSTFVADRTVALRAGRSRTTPGPSFISTRARSATSPSPPPKSRSSSTTPWPSAALWAAGRGA
jgi:hypothetical protein